MKQVVVAAILFFVATSVSGFQQGAPGLARRILPNSILFSAPTSFQLASSPTSTETDGEESVTVSKAQEILDEFHASNLPFRIVVIGNGAILETTSKLGRKCRCTIAHSFTRVVFERRMYIISCQLIINTPLSH